MPFKHNAARRHRIPRARYRITNWPTYEAGLRRRGDLTLWMDEAALDGWAAPRRSSPGGQPLYSDLAIELVLTLRLVFHLALRQAEAFSRSVLRLLGLALSIPDHSTLSRRGRAFARRQPRVQAPTDPIHLVLDSTGLELFGQGEWDAEKHGRLRRQWRKLHLAVDAGTGEIAAHVLTDGHADDAAQVPGLLGQAEGVIASVTADGAYDGDPPQPFHARRARNLRLLRPHTPLLRHGSAIHCRTLSSRPGHRRCQVRVRPTAAARARVTATSSSWPSAAAWDGRRRLNMAGATRPKRRWRDTST